MLFEKQTVLKILNATVEGLIPQEELSPDDLCQIMRRITKEIYPSSRTVRRLADMGVIPCHRNERGHRRFPKSAAAELILYAYLRRNGRKGDIF